MKDKSKSAILVLIGILSLVMAGHIAANNDYRIGSEENILENIEFNGGEYVSTEFIEEGRAFQIAGGEERSMSYYYNENGLKSLTVSMNVYYLNSTGLDSSGLGGGAASNIEKFESKVVTMEKNEYQYFEFEDNYAIALVSVGEVRGYNLEEGWKDEGIGKGSSLLFIFISLILFLGAVTFHLDD